MAECVVSLFCTELSGQASLEKTVIFWFQLQRSLCGISNCGGIIAYTAGLLILAELLLEVLLRLRVPVDCSLTERQFV